MIRYRKGNRVRDMVGLAFFAVAATLLWVESSMAVETVDSEIVATGMRTPSIGPATSGSAEQGSVTKLDRRDLREIRL